MQRVFKSIRQASETSASCAHPKRHPLRFCVPVRAPMASPRTESERFYSNIGRLETSPCSQGPGYLPSTSNLPWPAKRVLRRCPRSVCADHFTACLQPHAHTPTARQYALQKHLKYRIVSAARRWPADPVPGACKESQRPPDPCRQTTGE